MIRIPQFIKFLLSSLFATAIDMILFTVLDKVFHNAGLDTTVSIFLATILARIVDTIVNFTINKLWCFESKNNEIRQSVMFVILVTAKTLVSSAAVSALAEHFGDAVPHVVFKLAVDSLLFFVAYIVQKKLIFAEKPAVSEEEIQEQEKTAVNQ